jgi:hypothetical protein
MGAEKIGGQVESPSRNTASSLKLLTGLFRDHAELASLEFSYEKFKGWRRLLSVGAVATLFLCAFLFFQFVFIGVLAHLGLSLTKIGLLGVVLYGGSGALVLIRLIRKTRSDEGPFAGSRAEFKRSLDWIEKNFF